MAELDLVFECWTRPDGTEITFSSMDEIRRQQSIGLIGPDWVLKHIIYATNWEEAMQKHHQVMGYEPYKPF